MKKGIRYSIGGGMANDYFPKCEKENQQMEKRIKMPTPTTDSENKKKTYT